MSALDEGQFPAPENARAAILVPFPIPPLREGKRCEVFAFVTSMGAAFGKTTFPSVN